MSSEQPPFVYTVTHFVKVPWPGVDVWRAPFTYGVATSLESAKRIADERAKGNGFLVHLLDAEWKDHGVGGWGTSSWLRGDPSGAGSWQCIDIAYLDTADWA